MTGCAFGQYIARNLGHDAIVVYEVGGRHSAVPVVIMLFPLDCPNIEQFERQLRDAATRYPGKFYNVRVVRDLPGSAKKLLMAIRELCGEAGDKGVLSARLQVFETFEEAKKFMALFGGVLDVEGDEDNAGGDGDSSAGEGVGAHDVDDVGWVRPTPYVM